MIRGREITAKGEGTRESDLLRVKIQATKPETAHAVSQRKRNGVALVAVDAQHTGARSSARQC